MTFFEDIKKAVFLSRPNRFTLLCNLDGEAVNAFLPNSGRLWELLLPGVILFLEKSNNKERKLPYTAVAVLKGDIPVMLHTHKTNDVVHFLLAKGLIPGFEDVKVVKKEITKGRSRFDFLLYKGGKEIYLEVKSCSLFNGKVAMFPDAITSRGKRHLEELAEIANGAVGGAVLFLVNSPNAEIFMPEFHTDLEFAKTLCKVRDKIDIIPISIGWREDLSLIADVKLLIIPWNLLDEEAHDRGSYLIILRLPKKVSVKVGRLGSVNFNKGYYTYVGSAKKNLSKRIERHRRLRKKLFWHIDHLRAVAEFHIALPVRSCDDLECDIAKELKCIADWEVKSFGASDCNCNSHLFWTKTDPMKSFQFHSILQYFRMERLLDIE